MKGVTTTVGLPEGDLKAELTLRETQPNFSPSLAFIDLVLVPSRVVSSRALLYSIDREVQHQL
mgnify:FL=1